MQIAAGFDVNKEIVRYVSEREYTVRDPQLLDLCIKGIMSPVDGKKWPKSWLSKPTRLRTILDDKEDEYWSVLANVSGYSTKDVEEWNSYAKMEPAKRLRVFGGKMGVAMIYPGGRFFWDFLLVVNMKGKATLEEVMKDSVAGSFKPDILYPKWVWKYLRNKGVDHTGQVKREEEDTFGIDILEEGVG